MPASRVARGLAHLIEGIGEREQGARAVLAELDPQQVRAPGELHDLGRVEDQHLAGEATAVGADEAERRARPALPDDLLGKPDGQVFRLGHGAPYLLAGMRQPAGEYQAAAIAVAGQRAETLIFGALVRVHFLFLHVVEVGFQRVETVTPRGPVRGQPLIDLTERLGPQPVQAPLGVGSHLDQARLAQHPQVLRYAGLGDPQS